MDISIKWKNGQGKWQSLEILDIAHMPRDHALTLLDRAIPIVIKQDGTIISNSMDMRTLYRKKGCKVCKLDEIKHSDQPLSKVGFIGGEIYFTRSEPVIL